MSEAKFNEMFEFEFLKFDWSARLLKSERNSKKREENKFFCMIFLLFLLDFSTNISNKSFIVKYDLRCDFWCCFEIDVCDELDEDIKNIHVNLWWRDLNAIVTVDVIVETKNVIKDVKKQMSCAFVIKINKNDDVINASLNMKIIDEIIETNADFERRDDFVVIFEFVVIVFFAVMKDVIDKSIWLFFFR